MHRALERRLLASVQAIGSPIGAWVRVVGRREIDLFAPQRIAPAALESDLVVQTLARTQSAAALSHLDTGPARGQVHLQHRNVAIAEICDCPAAGPHGSSRL